LKPHIDTQSLKLAVNQLRIASRDADFLDPVKAAAHTVMSLSSTGTVAERNEAVAVLSAAIDSDQTQISGWLAIAAGAIVESGAEGSPLGNRLIECLPAVVRQVCAQGREVKGSSRK
jgi:hypothetical protein